MSNEDHNKFLAWIFLVHGGFQLLVTFVFLAVFAIILRSPPNPGSMPPPADLLLIIFGIMFVFQMVFVIPSLTAAYALLNRKSWARAAAIVAGIASAMNVPFGTLVCLYSVWFFLGDNWREVYSSGKSDNRQLRADMEARWSGYRTNERGELVFHPVDPPDWR
jgi:hypothetical protein